jgi:hypothetical protein
VSPADRAGAHKWLDGILDIVGRPVAAAAASMVSQKTSLGVLGMPPRIYLEILPQFIADGHEVVSVGKLRMVSREKFEHWLRVRDADRASGVEAKQSKVPGVWGELGLVPAPRIAGGRG